MLVLGGRSNLLLTRDFDGLLLHIRAAGIAIAGETSDAVLVRIAAGENLHALVTWTLAHGLGGLENLSLIPGNVGSSPMQNIGAYGVEIKDVFHELEAFDIDEKYGRVFSANECEFGYRESVFKKKLKHQFAILDVTFRLNKNPFFNGAMKSSDCQSTRLTLVIALKPSTLSARRSLAVRSTYQPSTVYGGRSPGTSP